MAQRLTRSRFGIDFRGYAAFVKRVLDFSVFDGLRRTCRIVGLFLRYECVGAIEEFPHMTVTAFCRFSAKDDTDQSASIPFCRRNEIEAGCTDITGLDAVHVRVGA